MAGARERIRWTTGRRRIGRGGEAKARNKLGYLPCGPEKEPTLSLPCSCCNQGRQAFPGQFTAPPPSPFLPAIKPPSSTSVFSLPRKKRKGGKDTRGELSLPCPALLLRLYYPFLPTCFSAHGRRGEVGSARGPAARTGPGAGGAGGQAGEGREGAGGDVLRRLPALRRRLPARVRPPFPSSSLRVSQSPVPRTDQLIASLGPICAFLLALID
jgi:hypothetical protein